MKNAMTVMPALSTTRSKDLNNRLRRFEMGRVTAADYPLT